jgi:hypothetical protein
LVYFPRIIDLVTAVRINVFMSLRRLRPTKIKPTEIGVEIIMHYPANVSVNVVEFPIAVTSVSSSLLKMTLGKLGSLTHFR